MCDTYDITYSDLNPTLYFAGKRTVTESNFSHTHDAPELFIVLSGDLAIWMDGTFTVNSTHNANSPKVTTDRKECGLTTTIREKKIKKNARYTAGRISGNRPSRTPKEAVIALPPLSFRKNGNACPNTGAMSTGIKSSE